MELIDKNPLLALKLTGERRKTSKSSWDIEHGPVIIAYGVGDGSLYKQVEGPLIWIASDLDDAHGFPKEAIEDENVICALDEIEVIKSGLWKSIGKPLSWAVMDGLDNTKIKEQVEELRCGMELLLGKAGDFGLVEMRNVFKNYGCGFDGAALFNCYKSVPAIICGAGPSLNKSFDLIKDALIFAGGSALGALASAGIRPTFGAGCDPKPVAEQIEKGLELDIPFFYTPGFSHELLKKVKGPKLQIQSLGALALEQWLWDTGGLDLGWNVATMTTTISYALGCDPIVFVGMDLAYTGGQTKAEGVCDRDDIEMIESIDKHGNKVMTRRDLLMSAKWIEEFIQKHPDRTYIDAMPEGLPIAGTQSMQTWSMRDVEMPLVALQRPEKQIEQMQESIKVCKALCSQIVAEYQSDKCALWKLELETEPFYKTHLKALWNLFQHVLPKEELHQWLFYKRVCDEA